jgi:hypothetical protein
MPIDMSLANAPTPKAPPRKTTRAKAAPAPAPAPEMSLTDMRTVGLMGIGQIAQLACIGSKQYAQAATFGMHWNPLAREIAVLADTVPVVAVGVDFLMQAGPYGALVSAALPFVMQTLTNYGLIQPTGNTADPKVLDAQMRAQIARKQAQAMREQQAAMQDAQNAQAEYDEYMASLNVATDDRTPVSV